MLDIKNIPLYRESVKSVPAESSKKVKSNTKYMDMHYDKSFSDNYFRNLYEGDKKK